MGQSATRSRSSFLALCWKRAAATSRSSAISVTSRPTSAGSGHGDDVVAFLPRARDRSGAAGGPRGSLACVHEQPNQLSTSNRCPARAAASTASDTQRVSSSACMISWPTSGRIGAGVDDRRGPLHRGRRGVCRRSDERRAGIEPVDDGRGRGGSDLDRATATGEAASSPARAATASECCRRGPRARCDFPRWPAPAPPLEPRATGVERAFRGKREPHDSAELGEQVDGRRPGSLGDVDSARVARAASPVRACASRSVSSMDDVSSGSASSRAPASAPTAPLRPLLDAPA